MGLEENDGAHWVGVSSRMKKLMSWSVYERDCDMVVPPSDGAGIAYDIETLDGRGSRLGLVEDAREEFSIHHGGGAEDYVREEDRQQPQTLRHPGCVQRGGASGRGDSISYCGGQIICWWSSSMRLLRPRNSRGTSQRKGLEEVPLELFRPGRTVETIRHDKRHDCFHDVHSAIDVDSQEGVLPSA